jgi:hypothetical protein
LPAALESVADADRMPLTVGVPVTLWNSVGSPSFLAAACSVLSALWIVP